MRIIRTATLSVLCAAMLQCTPAEEPVLRVIPYPSTVDVRAEKIELWEEITIIAGTEDLKEEAAFLAERLCEMGFQASVAGRRGEVRGTQVRLCQDASICNPEGYVMKIGQKRISISGGSDAGVFYGAQTLLQAIRNDSLYKGMIKDAPLYGWRGFMLDEARHFSGEERVKQILDIMAYYKMNRFHWHLTDAQGWRIEIKAWPELTATGAKGCHSDPDAPAVFYTQEQIRRIVEYASERHIEIIPEIDMPGHASAANRAYPQFNGGGSELFPDFTFNVGKEETYAFLTDILREVSQLFPAEYIHLGGDEVSYGSEAWKKDKDIIALMKRESLADIKAAESYFMRRMIDSVNVLGRKVIGWDELIDEDTDTAKCAIMWWRHDKPDYLSRALEGGYKTVMCPRKPLYFDFVQHGGHEWGRIWDGFCPLEDVYAFPDSLTKEMSAARKDLILGIQANLWSELTHSVQRVDFMMFPRLCALAEAAWTAEQDKDFQSFTNRLEDAYALFDELGIYYFDTRDPSRHPEPAGPVIRKREKPKMDFRD